MIRLVATDLDGTLLHSDGTITTHTREVLTAIEDLGVVVVFVTGRPIRWMDDLWAHVGGEGLAICSNGGIVYDVHDRAVIRSRTIPRDIGLEVAATIRGVFPGSMFAMEKPAGFAKEPVFLPQPDDAQRADLMVGPLEEVFDDQVVKLLALDVDQEPEPYWQRVEELVGHLVTTTWSSRGPLIEMSASGVTKASTLELLCAELEIASEEVMAFGDMPNDVAMLRWAGSSYAMANGHPQVLEAALEVAPPNDEDGVAMVLERLFLS